MNPRLIVLIVILLVVGLVAYRAATSRPDSDEDSENASLTVPVQPPDSDAAPTPQGREPDVEPAFECSIEVGMEGSRGNQEVAHITVREIHGWYVEGIYVEFWHRARDPDTGEWAPDGKIRLHLLQQVVPFNQVVTDRIVLVPHADHPNIPLGTSEDWECRVDRWAKVLAPLDD